MTNNDVSVPAAGWYPDPTRRYEQRYWDGSLWTDHAAVGGAQILDPIARDERPLADTQTSADSVGLSAHPVSRRERREQRVDESVSSPHIVQGSAAVAPSSAQASERGPAQSSESRKVPVFGARKLAEDLVQENARLNDLVSRHGLLSVADLEEVKKRAEAEVQLARQAVADARRELSDLRVQRDTLASEILDLRAVTSIQEFGLYDYENPAESSVELASELEALRFSIKQSVSRGGATRATSNFTFNNSAAKGQKFVNDMSKLMLRSYNAEAENSVKTVRAGT